MKIKEFLDNIMLEKNKKENENVLKLKQIVSPLCFSDNYLISIITKLTKEPVFFDDENFYRLVSIDELLSSDKELGFSIKQEGIIPLIDCGDNDYISYSIKDLCWCKYNIADNFKYNLKQSIFEIF